MHIRSPLILAVVSAIGLWLVACASTPSSPPADTSATQAQPETPGGTGDVVLLTVHGMSCPLCATNVDKQLLRVPGVESVSVDLSTGMIRVQVSKDQPPTSEALATAVRDSGFTLVGQPTWQ